MELPLETLQTRLHQTRQNVGDKGLYLASLSTLLVSLFPSFFSSFHRYLPCQICCQAGLITLIQLHLILQSILA